MWLCGTLFHVLTSSWQSHKTKQDLMWSVHFWYVLLFTRGHFWPSGNVIACVCVSMCPDVCVYQSRACPHDNSSLVEVKITKFRTRRAKSLSISTRGKFWPPGIVSACICPSVHHQFVCAITNNLFKLGTLNLDHRCKRPWLRSLLFWGVIDLDLQDQV